MADVMYIGNLLEKTQSYQEIYRNALPYPHIVLDNFFSEENLDLMLSEFPSSDSNWSLKWKLKEEHKSLSKGEEMFGVKTKEFMRYLNSEPILKFLEALTGISGLIPDPHFSGGGYHQIETGGFLKIHADFNKHRETKLDRRINFLIYLNKKWKEEYGGHFELWDREMKSCVKKILPIFGRVVIFSTSDYSYHGHPDPLKCPEGMTRKSLALYYYTNGRPAEEINTGLEDHDTLFKARPNEKYIKGKEGSVIKDIIRDCLPPILLKVIRKIKN
ncbi:MAG: 2OG-Fe(II) oxygenase [Bacteroidetes bacterium]|nr:2OG-Fe(II) oxygenase [Bacteroidota bacterium]